MVRRPALACLGSEPALKASSADQHRLIDLQGLDTTLDQLAHRERTLPEHARIAALDSELARVRDLLVAARTEHSDRERDQAKAEADVEQVRVRAERDQKRLDTGAVSSPKELESLQHELVSLARRTSELEDVLLEIMERASDAESRARELVATEARLVSERDETLAQRDSAVTVIEREAAGTRELRSVLEGQIDSGLLALYEKLRGQLGGVGAAALRRRRCTGCQLELNAGDLEQFRTAPEDEVLRCEECRRILVRTDESGL